MYSYFKKVRDLQSTEKIVELFLKSNRRFEVIAGLISNENTPIEILEHYAETLQASKGDTYREFLLAAKTSLELRKTKVDIYKKYISMKHKYGMHLSKDSFTQVGFEDYLYLTERRPKLFTSEDLELSYKRQSKEALVKTLKTSCTALGFALLILLFLILV